jgi:dGTPase
VTHARSAYDWTNEREIQRAHIDEPSQSPGDRRTPFERDRARIIHSVAFRRLQGKTQIFAPASGTDFFRTRVTHSIEVSQIGRALADRFDVPPSLVEAACLGHDLGHPPFGHTGEEVLDDMMKEHRSQFEGNAQTFRIVTYIEQKARDFEGLDLCRATLLGLLKYPYRLAARQPKFLYDEDANREEDWLFAETGKRLLTNESRDPPRTIPCQLMDWADDVAYSVHDLEDGIISGLLQPALWKTDEFRERVWRTTCNAPVKWKDGPPSPEQVNRILDELVGRIPTAFAVPKDVLREVTRHYIDKFATAGELTVHGDEADPFGTKFEVPEEIRVENQVLKSITFEFVIDDQRTTTLAFKGREIVRRLFEALYENTTGAVGRHRFLLFPQELRATLRSFESDEFDLARATCDYIAGMTEGQAVHLYKRLFEPAAGSPAEPV